MAPETLIKNAKFTEKSDVWSYGVTLWEIFSQTQRSPYFQYLENAVVSIKDVGNVPNLNVTLQL